jgi:8-oxo-dGTP pyrophosphatase MutT (NUDIX family)
VLWCFRGRKENMHTVFVNDKPLRFVNEYEVEEWKGNTSAIFAAESDLSIEDAVIELETSENHPGIIYMSASPDAAWKIFISYCQLSEAAGGLVMNDGEEYLIILRHNKWDLPKGKLDYDETPEQAAVREVSEECGLELPEIRKPLDKTFHTYKQDGKRILKKTHWFLMKASGSTELFPQLDEDITEAVWMTKAEVESKVYANTYASIKELLKHHPT